MTPACCKKIKSAKGEEINILISATGMELSLLPTLRQKEWLIVGEATQSRIALDAWRSLEFACFARTLASLGIKLSEPTCNH